MTSYHQPELDSATTDSLASSPRSDGQPHDTLPRVRFMCSFGGNILPRPHDNQLRYVGGETRILAVNRSTTFSNLISKLSKISGMNSLTLKYQLPNEDLDALISVTTDEDVENMIDEYDRLAQSPNPRSTARLRLFIFPEGEDCSRSSSTISSLLGGSANRESWFVDALNSRGLERGRSEASSMVSEVPDYLFGLDNSDETQPPRVADFKVPKSKLAAQDNVSMSDPGSPAPAASSPYGSTSSAFTPCIPPIPNLPPVKTKSDSPMKEVNQVEALAETVVEPQSTLPMSNHHVIQYQNLDSAYSGYSAQPMPVYYVPGPNQPGRVPVQPVSAQATPTYVQTYPVVSGQVPVGYHYQHLVPGVSQVYGGELRPAGGMNPYDASMRVTPTNKTQQVYYGVGSSGQIAAYPVMMIPGGSQESQQTGSEINMGRNRQ